MPVDGVAEAPTSEGAAIRRESLGLAVWIAYSGHGRDGNQAWMLFADGNVVVKNPDQEIRAKMAVLATRLGARVQGDEGEFYDDDGAAV